MNTLQKIFQVGWKVSLVISYVALLISVIGNLGNHLNAQTSSKSAQVQAQTQPKPVQVQVVDPSKCEAFYKMAVIDGTKAQAYGINEGSSAAAYAVSGRLYAQATFDYSRWQTCIERQRLGLKN